MLTVEGLEYHYGAHQVLAGLSCQLMPQQLGMLIGQNGAGKSTLLRCIAGWSVPDQGTITINGVSSVQHEQQFRRQVTFVPDTPDFYDELTAWEHLQLIAQLHRVPAWEAQSERLLNAFALDEQRNAFPFTFSRGMRYKLGLCLALLVHPPMLLLDEPFGPLDAVASQNLWQMFQNYVQEGGTVLFSSHAMPTDQLPDVILHLRHGQVEVIQPDVDTRLADLLQDVSDVS